MLRNSRKQELKEQIFSTAIALFQEKGFNHVTVEHITQACGIAKGTFYLYFPRKEAILLHLGRSQMEAVHQSILEHADVQDLKERLLLLFHGLFARYSEESDMIRLMISEMMRSAMLMEEEMHIVRSFQEALTALLQHAQKENQLLPSLDCADLAMVLVGIYFNTMMQWASSTSGNADIKTIFTRQFEVVWQGIRKREDEVSC